MDWAVRLMRDAADRLFLNCSRLFCKTTETKLFLRRASRLEQAKKHSINTMALSTHNREKIKFYLSL